MVLAVSVEQAHVPAVVGALPAWGAVEVAVVSAAAVVAAAAMVVVVVVVAVVAGGDNKNHEHAGNAGRPRLAKKRRHVELGEMNFVVKDGPRPSIDSIRIRVGLRYWSNRGEHFVAVNRFPKKKERTHD